TKAAKRQGEGEAQLAQSADAVQWQVLKPAEAQSTGGATLAELDDHSLLASGTIPRSDTDVVRLPAAGQAVTAIRLEALTPPSLPRTRPPSPGTLDLMLTQTGLETAAPRRLQRPLPIATALADH